MVTVKVLWRDTGKPVHGSRVAVWLEGLISGGVTDTEHTDDDGEAQFDIEPGNGEVYVDGDTKYRGRIAGRVVVYI